METIQYNLPQERIPVSWYNLQADFPQPMAPPLHPGTLQPLGPADLAPLFPMALIMQEVSQEREIEIPGPVRQVYAQWRPAPLYRARRLEKLLDTPAKIYYKYEGVSPAGSHKPNTAVAQAYYNKMEGTKKLATETGAGQWGSSLAMACAFFGLECKVYMGAVDVERQALNVCRMRLLGAEVEAVHSGSRTLKDAVNEAMRDWVATVETTHYCLGSVMGPHPYPQIVRDFQSVIGREVKKQIRAREGRLPDYLIACVGGGSNAMGLFYPFIDEPNVAMIGVEAAGEGVDSGRHAASITGGMVGVLHGKKTYVLQDELGQIRQAHSISAGLDYPGIGPEHAWLSDIKRVTYLSATDDEAVAAFQLCSRLEGIIPALEPAHALARVIDLAPQKPRDHLMVVNLSGRGDKDLASVTRYLEHRAVRSPRSRTNG